MLPPTIATTDHHTGGEPFRIVADPPVAIPGAAVVLRHDSIIGSTFTGAVLDTVDVAGRHAVLPQVTGMTHRAGEHGFVIDPHDPLVPRFVLR